MCNLVPHKHAEILRAIADGKPVQVRVMVTGDMLTTRYLDWKDLDISKNFSIFNDFEYRIKPKPLVKKWRWVVRSNGRVDLFVSAQHWANFEQYKYVFPNAVEFVQKVDSTMIELEE